MLDGQVVGGVTLRDLGGGLARLSNLALQPEARGTGAGRRLVENVLEAARAAGYESVELFTFSALTDARELYRRAGFEMTSSEHTVRWGREMDWERWELAL
jgi:ribosomal protein S18 acetylase RimI-like enzyme